MSSVLEACAPTKNEREVMHPCLSSAGVQLVNP